MNIWLFKNKDDVNITNLENYNKLQNEDIIYGYEEDLINGGFKLIKQFYFSNDALTENNLFVPLDIDIPYTLFYQTKRSNRLIKMEQNDIDFILQNELTKQINEENTNNGFHSFLAKIEYNDIVSIDKKWKNIEFVIGQPNTGKSYNFEELQLFGITNKKGYRYKKIPVSGGIGNEYKGLQNTDLALTFDPTKNEIRFGEFLQILMSAIANPKVPHVVFLDDFHNQDISSLMSEYTPLFKSQQMKDQDEVDTTHTIFTKKSYKDSNEFIKAWNDFIDKNYNNAPQVPLTNRISGESLKLVFPSNFYLFGAANFNENTLNIFADWEDRAKITYKDPIETFTLKNDESGFVECCKMLNEKLRTILEENNIFDYEKYCFGMWKLVDSKGDIVAEKEKQEEILKFFFGMIKNALRFNNKNSTINIIGWKLIITMYEDEWFKKFITQYTPDNNKLDTATDDKNYKYKILYKLNIYENEI